MLSRNRLLKSTCGLVAAGLIAATAGCSRQYSPASVNDRLSEREEGALSTGALGAAGGAVLGALAGVPALGAALGGGIAGGAEYVDEEKPDRYTEE